MGRSKHRLSRNSNFTKPERAESRQSQRSNRDAWTGPIERVWKIGEVEQEFIGRLRANPRNSRVHSDRQIAQLAASIDEFGFIVPVLVDAEGTVLAGHARIEAAKRLGIDLVPVIRIEHLTEAQMRAYVIADNRLAELASWNSDLLAEELTFLADINVDFDVEVTGFEIAEIDLLIETVKSEPDQDDQVPEPNPEQPTVSRVGDLWVLGTHHLYCGDARDEASYEALLAGQPAQMIITDPPYNVPIHGHVGGLGAVQHGEFIMASGEMNEEEYEAFLTAFVRNLIQFSVQGSVHFVFIDWRHLHLMEEVCRRHYAVQLNLCVWAKTNGGMGSLYRSQHELVLVLKNGEAKHVNNVRLGKYGRNRTNLWTYEGVNTINPNRRDDLAMHPTVKPVALVADAIKDCSKRNGIILDQFVGSGTTIIAAERTGRCCAALELDPRYVDVTVRRWEAITGERAQHAKTGLTFAEMTDMRRSELPLLPPPSNTKDRKDR